MPYFIVQFSEYSIAYHTLCVYGGIQLHGEVKSFDKVYRDSYIYILVGL